MSSPSDRSVFSTAAIAGGIVGGLGFLAALALIIFFVLIRRTDAFGRSRTRSAVSPYGGGRSFEFTSTSGDSAGGYAGANGSHDSRNGRSQRGTNRLDGRFGSGWFGGGKRKETAAEEGNDRTLTSSRKRQIYPGLSIASTQNRSIGMVTLDEERGQPAEDGRFLPGQASANVTTNVPATNGAAMNYGGVTFSNMPSAWRDAKRSEARTHNARDNGDDDNYTSGTMSIEPSMDSSGATVIDTEGINGANLTRRGSGYQSVSSIAHTQSLTPSIQYSTTSGAMLLNDSVTKTSTDIETHHSANRRNDGRPSTAPTQPNAGMRDFHLPTGSAVGRRSDAGHGEDTELYEHPHARLRLNSKTIANNGSYGVDEKTSEDAIIPNAPEGVVPERDHTRVEEGVDNPFDGRRNRSWAHPYAMAESPHPEAEPLPFSRPRQRPSATSLSASTIYPYSDPSIHNTASPQRPNPSSQGRRRDPTSSPPRIIRHVDAGPMMTSDDEEEANPNRRRRVVELPPSYGEVARGGRRQRE